MERPSLISGGKACSNQFSIDKFTNVHDVFWQCDEHKKKKYRLAKWCIMCQPKSAGGLRIVNLDTQNICLLSKWLFKLFDEEGLWQGILKKRYIKNKTLSQVEKKKGDSQFWAGLMEVKEKFLDRGRFVVHDGNQSRFGEDLWIGNKPLMEKYPSLYNIVRKKHVTVAKVLSTSPLGVSFRRALTGNNLAKWHELVGRVLLVQLDKPKDNFAWSISKTFTVHSMYKDLMKGAGLPAKCIAWKAKLPLKIKVFLWYLKQWVILTKDNLVKRKWKGCTSCCFCSKSKTIQHLFYCHLARLMWNIVSISFGFQPPTSIANLFGLGLKVFLLN